MKLKFRISFLLLFLFLFVAAQCPTPDPPGPPIPPEPPIEYISVWVCEDSQILSRIDCRKGILTEFIKGTEPTDICEIDHNPTPPIVYPEIIPDIHAGFLGIHLWYLYKNDTEELARTLHEVRIRGIGTIDFFLWLSDGYSEHAHLNQQGPYLYIGNGQFDLSKWNEEFFTKLETFASECAKIGLRVAPHLFMDRYCYGPFENNINGVSRFWTDEAFPFQKAFSDKVCHILDKYSDDYWIKPINEAAHYGSTDQFHVIGQWHRRMWDEVFQHHIRIDRLIVDVSMSEGAQIYLNEPLLCGKPYVQGEVHGDPLFDRGDATDSILAETHSIGTIDDFLPPSEALNFLFSKWRRYKLHGDGSSTGSFDLAGTGFRMGNAQEVYDMLIFLWTKSKSAGKQAIFAIFPMESFHADNGSWNLWFENYSRENIMWDRLDACARAWKEIYR